MRVPKNFFFVFLLASTCSSAGSSTEELHRLYKDHEWFKLTAAVQGGGPPLFFRAAVDCALNKTEPCIREMSKVIDASRGGDDEYEARSILAAFYLRQGQYRQSLAQTQLLLKIRPNDSDAQSSRAFLNAASTFQDQKVSSRASAHVSWVHPGKSLTIPVTIDGKQAKYFIDTGANLSTISDADAQRLGLEVHQANFKLAGSAGQSASFKIANAKHVKIGSFELENVVFAVSPANQPPFNDMSSLKQGIIGLPVLLAAKHIRWNRNGFEIISDRTQSGKMNPNLALDEGYPIVEATFQGHPLSLLVDSGSDWSYMYPRFTHDYSSYVRAHGTKTTKKLEGFGGQANPIVWRLPELPLRIGGTVDQLRPVDALVDYTDQKSRQYDGCLGLDTMLNRDLVDFDFRRHADCDPLTRSRSCVAMES